MMMPPYHGTALKAHGKGIREHWRIANAIDIPIMLQDAPLSGVTLSVRFLARWSPLFPKWRISRSRRPARQRDRGLIEAAGDAVKGRSMAASRSPHGRSGCGCDRQYVECLVAADQTGLRGIAAAGATKRRRNTREFYR